jgi:farnesyl diphosphate synthase
VTDPFANRLDAAAADTQALLDRLLGEKSEPGEITRPQRLLAAMRHATLGGGKRLRPFLLIETATLFDSLRERALMAGAALECVHCYSLVHDDLPAMDNDDLRRGRPTAHKAFDEATAILAGDGLLTFAFDVLARPETHPDAAVRIALVMGLARAAGLGGMVGGQMLDLAAEGRFGKNDTPQGEQDVLTLQAMKTGAILKFCCVAGAILGHAPKARLDAVSRYGQVIGQAFQIADDLLDVEGDAATLGKAAGKDAALGKATLVDLLGVAGARARLAQLVLEAESTLAPFGADGAILKEAARFIAERRAYAPARLARSRPHRQASGLSRSARSRAQTTRHFRSNWPCHGAGAGRVALHCDHARADRLGCRPADLSRCSSGHDGSLLHGRGDPQKSRKTR